MKTLVLVALFFSGSVYAQSDEEMMTQMDEDSGLVIEQDAAPPKPTLKPKLKEKKLPFCHKLEVKSPFAAGRVIKECMPLASGPCFCMPDRG